MKTSAKLIDELYVQLSALRRVYKEESLQKREEIKELVGKVDKFERLYNDALLNPEPPHTTPVMAPPIPGEHVGGSGGAYPQTMIATGGGSDWGHGGYYIDKRNVQAAQLKAKFMTSVSLHRFHTAAQPDPEPLLTCKWRVEMLFTDGGAVRTALATSARSARDLAVQDCRMGNGGQQFNGQLLSASAKVVK